jgi:hypothetical protein
MGKPYSDLEKHAIRLITVQPDYTQWTDEEVRKYWAWKIRADKASHNLPSASERPSGRKLSPVYLKPFGKNLPATVFYQAGITTRSKEAKVNQGLTDEVLGYLTPGADANNEEPKRFKPARVYYRTGAATTPVTRTSRITGREYKTYYAAVDQGYSMPFGKKGTDTEAQRHQEIIAAIGNDIHRITFTPERI